MALARSARAVLNGALANIALLALAACGVSGASDPQGGSHDQTAGEIWLTQLNDDSDGDDWPAFGRTYGEQHYSPLAEINADNVGKLGLVWAVDLPTGNPATGPIEVNGTVYLASGYSVVRAIDVASGKVKWTHIPRHPRRPVSSCGRAGAAGVSPTGITR